MTSVTPPDFADERWFDRVHSAIAPLLPLRENIDARLQYDVDVEGTPCRWRQVIVDGQLREFGPGELADADVEIHWSHADAIAVLGNRVDGTQAMAATTIVADTEQGPYRGPAPPMDLAEHPELAELPTIPEATLIVQQHLRGGPFGDFDCVQVFVDGRLNRMTLGTLPDPDIIVDGPYRTSMLLRAGAVTALEGLESARISGSVGSLSLFGGLLESNAFQQAQRACAHAAGLALASLGEIAATPGFRSALADAM